MRIWRGPEIEAEALSGLPVLAGKSGVLVDSAVDISPKPRVSTKLASSELYRTLAMLNSLLDETALAADSRSGHHFRTSGNPNNRDRQ